MEKQTAVTVDSEAPGGDHMAHYDSVLVVCPYFHRYESNFIRCEGVEERNTIKLVFEDSKKLKEYKEKYCCSMQNHKNCIICGALNRMYEEKYK